MGGDAFFRKFLDRWNETAADTNGGGVTATKAAPGAGKKLVCSGIQCSGDAAALVTIESPSGTVLWRKRFAAAFTMSETFAPGTIKGGVNEAMLVKSSAGTTNTEANMQGYTMPGQT